MNERAGTTLLEEIEIDVRWGDMDALGHVNNAVYFTYFEQIRIAWLDRYDLGSSLTPGAEISPVIVNAACTFHRAIVYPARLRLRMLGGPPGRSSFDSRYEVRDAADGEVLYACGAARIVWVDRATGRSTPIPEAVRALLPPPPA